MTAPREPDGEPPAHGRARSKAARLEIISEAVRREGFVNVDDLAASLHVSRMTVHRDLDELQERGALRKVRGGASAERSTRFESDLAYRLSTARDEKLAIAAAAAGLVGVGEVVIIDDSTSALQLVPHLTRLAPVTVVTNSMPVMQALGDQREVTLIGLGGQYDERHGAFLGALCETALAGLYADVLFTSTSSMLGTVLYHQDQRIVTTKRAMLRAAARRVLLLDHTKVGHGALYRLCDITEFTHVVVDDKMEHSVLASLRETGVEVVVAS